MDIIDLSGEWKLFTEKEKTSIPDKYIDTINLPDSLSHAKKCLMNDEKATGYLTDIYKYEGYCWFQKEIEIANKYFSKAEIFLERTRNTELYIDGHRVGNEFSLCSPHRYDVTRHLTIGIHTVSICVSNVDYLTPGGHLTSPDTQTNWLGILGKMELRLYPDIYIQKLKIETDINRMNAVVSGEVIGCDNGEITLYAEKDGNRLSPLSVMFNDGHFTADYPMTELWDEFTPNVYTMTAELNGEKTTAPFGMVAFSNDDIKLKINNKTAFLRGKHDGMIFPDTGYAPTDVESWLRVMKAAKEYGINHYRFHTCCPPDAAFIAADRLGIYMEPELPFWGTITTPKDKEHNETQQQFLISEGKRMIDEFGNHPSFVMMSLGNELWGSAEKLNEILHDYKKIKPSIFYTDGSNNFQFYTTIPDEANFFVNVRFSEERLFRGSYAMCDAPQGHIQTERPNSVHNYDDIISGNVGEQTAAEGGEIEIQYGTGVKKVKATAGETDIIPHIPVISHEVGQYYFFPDFEEKKLYNGSLKPKYLDVYRSTLEKAGLYSQQRDFFNAVGRLSVDCYKREIEAAMRSENLSGFQLLDIQDFTGQGVALVGVLNAFMKSKGFIDGKEWQNFCGINTVMAELPKFVYGCDEDIEFDFAVNGYGPNKVKNGEISYNIKGKSFEKSGKVSYNATEKRVNRTQKVKLNIKTSQAEKAEMKIRMGDCENNYTLWLYPQNDVVIEKDVIKYGERTVFIAHNEKQAEEMLKDRKKLLLITDESDNSIPNTYCADFWNFHMFNLISNNMGRTPPVGTLGMLVKKDHPIFSSFPTDEYTQSQWFNIIMHSHCDILDGTDITPIAQPIDNIERCHKLGLIYEKEIGGKKVTVLTSKIWEIAECPEAKQLAISILEYIYT